MVVEIDLTADDGIPAGVATLSFTVVRRPEHVTATPSLDLGARAPLSGLEPGAARPDDYLAEIGVTVTAPGTTEVELVPEVSNTVGALHGAVHAAMVDEAAASLGRHLLGPAAESVDLHLAFLELGRAGPLRAVATALGDASPHEDRLTAEVRLVDADGRTCSYATVGVVVP
jgi:acyl-coenzyme A thioesterase PaaI-like protein